MAQKSELELHIGIPFLMYFERWITNGVFADYFTVGCRTKVPNRLLLFKSTNVKCNVSQTGFTVILVPRKDGVETRPVKTSYSATAGKPF
jgi:alkylation response protein AidB-like acyl-CoA dehydrogenase